MTQKNFIHYNTVTNDYQIKQISVSFVNQVITGYLYKHRLKNNSIYNSLKQVGKTPLRKQIKQTEIEMLIILQKKHMINYTFNLNSLYYISKSKILKMLKNRSLISLTQGSATNSLANKYGVSSTLPQGQFNSSKQNMSSSVGIRNKSTHIGMNPNLNIEDQYIQNLLKQAHFMNLQIKLLKEKQKQSEGNGLWGVINRTKQPMVNNIVQSSQKYAQMKKEVDEIHNRISMENISLANDQTALIKTLHFLQDRKADSLKRKKHLQDEYRNDSAVVITKIDQNSTRLQTILSEKQLIRRKNDQMKLQLDKINSEAEKDKLRNNHEMGRIRKDEIIQQILIKEKQQVINTLSESIKLLKDKFAENIEYQKAQEDQVGLKRKIMNLQKNIASYNFDLLQLKESIKLADVEKDNEVKQRKSLTEEFESIKIMVKQILVLNLGRKQKETTVRKQQSLELKKAQEQTIKLEKNLQEIKRKLSKCEQSEKILKVEVQTYEAQLQKLKSRRQQLLSQHSTILKKNQIQEGQLVQLENHIRIVEDKFQKVSSQQYNSQMELLELQKKLHYLRGRKQFLMESANLKDTMNEIKMQELHRVVQKNTDLNETVSSLMQKWEEIKKFSRL